ncbi:MAG: 16S rRNA (adenine(1518)-N(6)/adenine(1519)-N(6))-dimethyltransferase RsmA [Bacteroidota bacterium]
MDVRAKKHLGQHFLVDQNVSKKIANQFGNHQGCSTVLEIGPGTGALTKFLLEKPENDLWVIEVDRDSIAYLKEHYPQLKNKILEADFLKLDVNKYFGEKPFAVVGNFPYNISSQILFKCLDHRNQIPEIMGMFQKEVAERVAEKPGSKTYGIISVLLQAFYDIQYCFTVDENVFNPPPKVKSGVIRLTRNSREQLPCDEKMFIRVVKACFNQRRKMIRNSVKQFTAGKEFEHRFLTDRPERLSVDDFIELTLALEAIN